MTQQRFSIKISREQLEEFLFNRQIKINHIEFDHSTQMLILFLEGAGSETAEGQTAPILNLERALEEIRKCLKTPD